MTHAGHSLYSSEKTPDRIAAVAEQERLAIVTAAEKVRAAGISLPHRLGRLDADGDVVARLSPALPRCGPAFTSSTISIRH